MSGLFMLVLVWGISAAEGRAEDAGKHLFILSGQSNMARLDPAISFTPAVEAAFGKENVIVVKDAHAGQPIRRWYKKWDDAGEAVKTPPGDLYEPLLAKVMQAVQGQKVATVTFIWMQGESDAVKGKADRYEEALNGLIAQLAQDIKREDIQLVLGRLSDCSGKGNTKSKSPEWIKIRELQMRIGETRPHSAWVNTDDLNDILDEKGQKVSDDLHYTPEGYRIFGERLAEKAIGLIRGN